MRLWKYGHASVALEADGRRLVVDPGGLTPEDALAGAQAVLVTHEHFDHFSPQKLTVAMADDPALEVWTNASVAGQLGCQPRARACRSGRGHVLGGGF